MKAFLITSAMVMSSLYPAFAESKNQMTNFNILITERGGEMTSLNMAFGNGSDVRFLSNIDGASIDWNDNSGPIKTGTLLGKLKNDVTLEVCAGNNCEIGQSSNFTTHVNSIP